VIGPVLVPHDLTPLSDAGLAAVRGLEVGKVHVVHALPRIDPSFPGLVWPRDEDRARTEHAVQALRERLDGLGFGGAEVHVALGDPASRIVELAEDLGVAMIAMPSHSRTGLRRFLLGSVAEHVARFAPCPVLILPASVLPATVMPEPAVDVTPEEQLDALACELMTQATDRPGFLTAARIAIPPDRHADWWEEALTARLGEAGIEFVDLSFTPAQGRQAEILVLRFEDRFV
jgi:nucleotide-binding universal stress UspA family protein